MVETILANLIYNQAFFTKVWPYMDKEYFEQGPAQTVFNIIKKHVNEYTAIPSKTALCVGYGWKNGVVLVLLVV